MPYTGVSETTSFDQAISLLEVNTLSEVASEYLEAEIGVGISNVTYTGAGGAAFLINEFNVEGAFEGEGGFLLSSGGFPGNVNTATNSSIFHGTDGDDDLTQTAQDAFQGAGVTQDAAVIEFTYTVTDADVDGVSFDIIVGSDEFPEFSDTNFTDIAAVYVNGVNVALFQDDPNRPLSVISENIDAGNFFDNTTNAFPIEWDGFSQKLTVRAPLVQGENQIKIGVADTGDSIYDTGLYVENIELLTEGGTGGGVLTVVNGDDGDNEIDASLLAEEINLGQGEDTVAGAPEALDGDIITGFGADDALLVQDVNFGLEDLTVTLGSAILDIDTDGDNTVDTTVTLAGNFENAKFQVSNVDGDSVITVQQALNIIGTNNADLIDGGAFNDTLLGLDGQDTINGDAGADFIRGQGGADLINGGDGADTVLAGVGGDTINGGLGADDLRGRGDADLIDGGLGDDFIKGGGAADTIQGGGGADTIEGGADVDLINGGAGADSIKGGFGDDIINGDGGADTLDGGAGGDVLNGGAGRDLFLFRGRNFGDDTIEGGFQQGKDMIEIRANADFDDLTITQAGDDVLIDTFNASITVENANAADFTEDDFIFS